MKNYYDQQQELEVAKNRLRTLKEKKELYFNETQPKSKKINGVMVMSTPMHNDKFLEYTAKIEYLDDEIDVLENEVRILENHLIRMECNLKSMKGILERIFVDRFIEGMSIKKIAKKYNYSESNVYELVKKIKKIIYK